MTTDPIIDHTLARQREEGDMEKDVNYLLHRQQIAMALAQASRSVEVRAAYSGLAQGYTDQIVAYRRENERLVARVC